MGGGGAGKVSSSSKNTPRNKKREEKRVGGEPVHGQKNESAGKADGNDAAREVGGGEANQKKPPTQVTIHERERERIKRHGNSTWDFRRQHCGDLGMSAGIRRRWDLPSVHANAVPTIAAVKARAEGIVFELDSTPR